MAADNAATESDRERGRAYRRGFQAGRRAAMPVGVSDEDAEMWCERCGRRHGVVWFAPSDLWNAVMRESDRGKPDEFGFCCPLCFMQLADERIGPMIFEVRQEVFDAVE